MSLLSLEAVPAARPRPDAVRQVLAASPLVILVTLASFTAAYVAFPDPAPPVDSEPAAGSPATFATERRDPQKLQPAPRALVSVPARLALGAIDSATLRAGDELEIWAVAYGPSGRVAWESVLENVRVLDAGPPETPGDAGSAVQPLTLQMNGREADTLAYAARTGRVRIRRSGG